MHNFGYSEEGYGSQVSDLGLWLRILHFCKPQSGRLAAAIILSFAITVGTLALPWLLQQGIDRYITAASLDLEARLSGLGVTALIYGLVIIAVFAVTFSQVVLLELVGQSVMHSLRQALFRHLLQLDLSFFQNRPVGQLVTRLTNDIQNMNEMFTSIMVTLFNDLFRFIGIFIVLVWMNPRLALLMALFIPLAIIVTIFFSRLARKQFRLIRTQLARLNSFFSEAVGGMSVIQTFNQETMTRGRYQDESREYLQRTLGQIRLFGLFLPMTEFMSTAAIAVILWYGGGEVLHRTLTLGELVAFISYMRLFFQPLRELSQKYSIVQSAVASAERIFHLLDEQAKITNKDARSDQESLTPIRGRVSFEQVSFAYDESKPVLDAVNLTIEPGETIALVGATGSGKTTMINLLLRFYDPDSGRITLDGRPLASYRLKQLRQVVTVVMQDVFLLPESVQANIVLDQPLKVAWLERVIEETGLATLIATLPLGLETRIGEGGQNLSAGEKQLLVFARALYRNPAILVLDEATAAVDTRSENMLENALTAICRNRTSIIIAHRLSTVRRAGRIIVMEGGRILEQGSHLELMAQNSTYRQLVEIDRTGSVDSA